MKNRPTRASKRARELPLDHLRPGGRQPAGAGTASMQPEDKPAPRAAEPAEPKTPGAGDAEALRGKATRSPAETATRPHLEGSEQGPV